MQTQDYGLKESIRTLRERVSLFGTIVAVGEEALEARSRRKMK
jgi:hypothetical protein